MNQEIQAYIRIFTTYTQDDWALLLPSCMLAINNRTASSIGISPFFATHGYHVDPIQIDESTVSQLDLSTPRAQLGKAFVERLRETTDIAQAAMATAQQQQEEYANRKRNPAESFRVGDSVWLDLQNIRTDRPTKKFDWLHAKYRIVEIVSSHSYKLNTPDGIHPVFHVDLLRRDHNDPFPSQQQDDTQPPPVLVNEFEEYGIEEILRARTRKVGRGKRREAQVKWVGYVTPTWEPVIEVKDTEALDRFESLYGPISENDGPPL